MTKSNKFEHLEIKLLRFSYLLIKSRKFGTLKDTMIGFKLETKKQPLRDGKNWDFKPKKYDEHPLAFYHMRTPTPPHPPVMCTGKKKLNLV